MLAIVKLPTSSIKGSVVEDIKDHCQSEETMLTPMDQYFESVERQLHLSIFPQNCALIVGCYFNRTM